MTLISNTARQIASVRYENGRWGPNTASVLDNDGEFLFFNGFGDPYGFSTPVEALDALRAFVASKTVDFRSAIKSRDEALSRGDADVFNALDAIIRA